METRPTLINSIKACVIKAFLVRTKVIVKITKNNFDDLKHLRG
jgi:hypothetical protein